ncbi:complex I subunit 5 family protein [Chakrabartyella piscis]|uniref:complex I subunit 5 family protein n=1 Tax=Chakrabartyella piscis TaxID=2918914 RepID=UPI0029589970|nr:proton-conducting transporter membrane subunit [Chakrabartyella piscis]
MNYILLVPVFFPMLMAGLLLLVPKEKEQNIWVVATLVIEAILVFGLYLYEDATTTLWRLAEGVYIAYKIDGLGHLFACLFAVIWMLVSIYAIAYMKHEERPRQFFFFYLLALGALMSLCFAKNMMTLYLSYEYMTLLTVPLVIHTREKQAVRAGLKYLGYSIFGAGLGLLGFFFLHIYCTTTDFVAGGSLNTLLVAGNESLLLVVAFLMILGFACKAGMFPLHAWLPTAHPVAPTPASAVLSGIITKAGVFCILRVIFFLFGADFIGGTWVQKTLLILILITVFMGSMLAYKERILKKRLAYSTVSQVSYVLFGILLLSPIGLMGALLQVVFHALAKNLLFLSAGAIISETGETLVSRLSGIGKQMPIVMGCFTIGALSLVGIPPTAGFVSKWFLAQGGLSETIGFVGVIILMVSAFLTAGYLLSIVVHGFFPQKEEMEVEPEVYTENRYMTVPLVILAFGILCLGVYPSGLQNVITEIVTHLF